MLRSSPHSSSQTRGVAACVVVDVRQQQNTSQYTGSRPTSPGLAATSGGLSQWLHRKQLSSALKHLLHTRPVKLVGFEGAPHSFSFCDEA